MKKAGEGLLCDGFWRDESGKEEGRFRGAGREERKVREFFSPLLPVKQQGPGTGTRNRGRNFGSKALPGCNDLKRRGGRAGETWPQLAGEGDVARPRDGRRK